MRQPAMRPPSRDPIEQRMDSPPAAREQKQFEQLVGFTKELVRQSEVARQQWWASADVSSVERWNTSKQAYWRYLWEEILGKLPAPSEVAERPNARPVQSAELAWL